MKDIGLLLKQHRLKSCLSQENIADFLGVDASIISKIENGKTQVKFDSVLQYCAAMEVTLEEVMASKPPPKTEKNTTNINININFNITSSCDFRDCLKELEMRGIIQPAAKYGSNNNGQ